MALIKADRVKETSTSTGTGTIALAGAATGYRAFSAVCAVGDTLYYAIAHQTAGEWEVGLATYSAANTLTRTTVHASSNSNLAVTFSAGTKDVFLSVTKAWLDTFVTQTSGTANYVAKTTGTGTIGNSQIFDNGTSVGIGTNSPFSYAKIQCVISAAGNWPFYSQGTTGNFGAGFYIDGNNAGQMYVADGTGAYKAQISSTGSSYVTNSFGIGTSSPAERLHLYKSGDAIARIEGTSGSWVSFHKNSVYCGYIGAGSAGSNDLFIYNLASAAVRINNKAVYVTSSDTVGINETSPGAQLQVTTAAAATKGLIVKGASAQSAFMFEVQDSNGRASVAATNSFSTTSVDSGGQLFVQVNDAVAANIGAQISLGGNYVGTTSTTFGAISAKKENATSGNYAGYLQLITSTNGVGNTEKVRITSTGDVGIGATSPVAKLQLGTGADVMANAGGLTVVGGGLVLDGAGTYADRELYFRYTSTVATISADKALRFRTSNGNAPVEAMRIDVSGNVGIGTASPSTKLDVAGSITSKSTSGDRLIFKRSSDNATMTQIGTDGSSETYITSITQINLNNSGSGLRLSTYANWADSTAAENIWVKHSNLVFQQNALAPLNRTLLNTSYFQVTAANYNAIPAPTSRLEVYGDTRIESQAAATKALVVRGASGQSANLQEWQNNSGTALATVSSNGSISAPNIYGGGGYFGSSGSYTGGAWLGVYKWLGLDGQYVNIRKLYGTRVIPTVVGNYVELARMGRYGASPVTVTIHANTAQGQTGQAAKQYEFCTSGYMYYGGTVPPTSSSVIAGPSGSFDFELEIALDPNDGNYITFRVRRTVGTANADCMFTIEVHNFNSSALLEASNTGTSTTSLSYLPDNRKMLSVVAPPPAGGSGSGTGLSISAASPVTNGDGGSITFSATGKVGTGTSDGAFVFRNTIDGYNRSTKKIIVRSIPDTVGNYIEIGRIGWLSGHLLKISVQASRGAYDAANATYNALGKEYEHYAHYYTTGGILSPKNITGTNGGGRQPNEFELESIWDANGYNVLRLRRSKADATNYSGYTAVVVIEQLVWSPHGFELVETSGTGTSTLGSSYIQSGVYSQPYIFPPPPPGTSGSGSDLSLYGASAIGTGNGGSILLQAGAYATSGSNGKVIVRGLASNTANLQEWQNNAGTALVYISSNGSVIGTPSTCYIGANDNSGGQIALYGHALGYGVGIRPTSLGGDVVQVKSGQVSITTGQGGNNAALIVNAYVGPSGSVATFANLGDAASKVIIAKGKASQTGNLQEWQNSSGTALASVSSAGSFNCSGFSTNEGTIADGSTPNLYRIGDYYYCRFTRDLPITAGSYVELFEISDSYASRIEMQAWSYQHGVESTFRTYDSSLSLNYSTNGIFQPTSHIGANSWEIEKVFIAPTVCRIRIRRTKTVTASPAPYAIVDIRFKAVSGASDIKSYSGTGTSSVGNNYLPSGTVSQGTITPTPPVGDSGNGRDLSIVGGSAAGTGNGGNIILQAGAYSTSGSNGKVIVRGLASNTANLQEWQNNAGTAGTWISSSGSEVNTLGINLTSYTSSYIKFDTSGNGLYRSNSWMGVGSYTFASGFFIESSNYGRPNMRSGYPDGASSIGNIITTTVDYANASAKLLSVQNNGTEKFAVFSDGSMAGVDARLTGSIKITSNTPSAFTADQNNLVLNASGFQRLSGTAARTITGIAPPSGASHVDGRMMRIYNVGSYNITLKHNSTSSSIANRFCCVQAIDIVLGPRDFAELIYDATDGGLVSGQNNPCWRVA